VDINNYISPLLSSVILILNGMYELALNSWKSK